MNMSQTRKIKNVSRSKPTIEGAGVHLKRAFAFNEVPAFDPFLLLDDFRSDNPAYFLKGFPWHPHRGIETITYVIDGNVEHGDSMGNKGNITSGDVQWMTAGSGIIHQEMPKGDSAGRMGGFQLWANLPASQKMMDPRYRDVNSAQIPEVTLDGGVKIKIISGTVAGVTGPVKDIVIEPEYLDVAVPANSQYIHATRPSHNVFAYIINGQGHFCKEKLPSPYEGGSERVFCTESSPLLANEDLVHFSEGDNIAVSTQESPMRFLLVSGKPLKEPVAWYGPIVMNTQSELRTAFEEYENGTFIKHKGR